jgi:hypothetical protein
LKSALRAFRKKRLFNLPQVLINAELYGLVSAPRLKKGYHQIWEAISQPLGANVPAFINNLGPICNPKMLKVGP